MYEELLTEIGLTKSEIAVYFALLEIGSSTTGPIIKKSRISSGKAYLILDKLTLKGLTTHAIKSGVKYYQATNPERLLDYLKEKELELKSKEQKLRQIIPTLKEQYEEKKYKQRAEIYEGWKGFKTFYDWTLKVLKRGEEILILGVSKEAVSKINPYIMGWNRKRIKLGIKMRILYNHDCQEFGKIREKLSFTKVGYLPKELETPAWIDIFQDYVVTSDIHATPVCFLIRNKPSADSYKKYFEILWKQST